MKKSVIITGVNGDIGKAVARCLRAAGMNVVGVDVKDSDYLCDFTDPSSIQAAVHAICQDYEDVPLALIHCAGVYQADDWQAVDYHSFSEVIAVNASGPYLFSALWAKAMIDAGQGGSCVVLSSISAQQGSFNPAYAASKAALEGMLKSLARSWGGYNIRINAVAPGPVESAMFASVPEERQQFYKDQIPLKRFACPDDVANAVAFLVSEEAAYINGAILPVDGGMS